MSTDETEPQSSRVLGHGLVYVAGTVLQNGLGLLLLPVVTRVLGVEEYGLAGTGVAVAVMLAIVYGLGISYSSVRYYYDDPPTARSARWAALLRVQVLIAAALAGVTFATGPIWAGVFEDFGWNGALQAAVIYGFAISVQTTTQGILRAARRPVSFVLASLVQAGVGAGLGIALAIEHDAAGYIAGLTIGSLLAALIAAGVSYRAPAWDRETISGGIRLGLPAMVHSLANWGLDLAMRLMVAGYLGLAAVGRYQVAFLLGSALTLVLTGIQSAYTPFYVGELSPEERRATPAVLMLPVTAVVLAATMLLVLLAPVLLEILVPSGFHGTELVLGLAAASTIARGAYYVATAVLLDFKRSASLARGSLAGAALAVVLAVALIPTVGVEGAAIAAIAGVMTQAAVVIHDAGRRLGQSLHLPLLVTTWIAGAGALAGLSQIPDSEAGTVVRVALALCVAAGGLLSVQWLRRSFAGARRAAGAPLCST